MNKIKIAGQIAAGAIKSLYKIRKERKWAAAYIKEIEQQFDGKMTKSATDRAVVSYGGFIPLVIDGFTQLRGRNANAGEKERIILYFLCSSLFDDFCEHKQLTTDELYRISYHPKEFQPRNFEERVFLHAHLALLDYVKDKTYYDTVTKELFAIQLESAKQQDPLITDEEIKRITITKGGSSTLLCHFFLDEVASPVEQACWRHLGFMLQVTDDLLDLYDDFQENMETLPGRMKDTKEFYVFFMGIVDRMKELLAELPFPNKRKIHLLFSLMGVSSVGRMVLQQLMDLQGNAPQLPDLKKQPRKVLIIDMAKPRNILYCIKFSYRQTLLSWERM